MIISPNGESGSLSVYQDARVYAGLFDGNEQFTLSLPENRAAYVHVARGVLEVNGYRLNAGDGAKILNESQLSLNHGQNAEVLVFDLRSLF